MAVKPSTLAALTVLVAVLALATPAGAISTCVLFKDCASCTCNVPNFDMGKTSKCDNNLGCAWSLSSNKCVLANDTDEQDVITSFFFPGLDTSALDDDWEVDEEYVTCPIPTNSGTIIVSVICLCLTIVFAAIGTYRYYNMWRLYFHPKNDWLATIARSHAPPGDIIQWIGGGRGTKPPFSWGQGAGLMLMFTAPLYLPTLIWLLIGLPSTIAKDNFGFYFPVCFVGGMGLAGNALIWLLEPPLGQKGEVNMYCLTDKHLIRVGGKLDSRTQTSVKVDNCSGIVTSVVINNDTVKFSMHGYDGTLSHLADTSQVFHILRARMNAGAVIPPFAPGSAPVPVVVAPAPATLPGAAAAAAADDVHDAKRPVDGDQTV